MSYFVATFWVLTVDVLTASFRYRDSLPNLENVKFLRTFIWMAANTLLPNSWKNFGNWRSTTIYEFIKNQCIFMYLHYETLGSPDDLKCRRLTRHSIFLKASECLVQQIGELNFLLFKLKTSSRGFARRFTSLARIGKWKTKRKKEWIEWKAERDNSCGESRKMIVCD